VHLDLERRDTSRASRIGKVFQELLGIDARMIDQVVGDQFGGVGKIAMQASDLGREDRPGRPFSAAIGLSVRSPASAARDVQYVWEQAATVGMSGNAALKPLSNALRDYYEADGRAGKDTAAEKVRTVATDLRKQIEGGLLDRLETTSAAMRLTINKPQKKKGQPQTEYDRAVREWQDERDEATEKLRNAKVSPEELSQMIRAEYKRRGLSAEAAAKNLREVMPGYRAGTP
jgi:hypothetical protein